MGSLSRCSAVLRLIIPVVISVFWGVFWPVPLAAGASPEFAAYREAQWQELVPESWHPEKLFEGINPDELTDGDPRAIAAMAEVIREWQNAPVNQELQGQRIKLPGYVAPLDWEKDGELKEFLLVPYFGACIHVPPPPANQIIYIKMEKALTGIQSMDAIWVYGTLALERNDSGSMGASGYSMFVDKVELYAD
ncbi:MAG: DUF3299 domain-containing protein [Deltaproteobacteria bacterium]|jgi:hypothetical protein|nr:DUF3299 domain-containing protein [Deltaproteobacteria bacterium]